MVGLVTLSCGTTFSLAGWPNKGLQLTALRTRFLKVVSRKRAATETQAVRPTRVSRVGAPYYRTGLWVQRPSNCSMKRMIGVGGGTAVCQLGRLVKHWNALDFLAFSKRAIPHR